MAMGALDETTVRLIPFVYEPKSEHAHLSGHRLEISQETVQRSPLHYGLIGKLNEKV